MVATRRGRGQPTEAVDETASVDPYLFTPRFLPPRQYINPVRGLTPAKAVALIDWGQYGFKADLQWTYAAIERKGPVLRALKDRRLSAIKKLKWTIRVKDSLREKYDEDDAVKSVVDAQKEALKDVYDRVDNLKEALSFLALATFRGYAHLEKHFDDDGFLSHLEPVPQWYWCFSYPVRDWLFNPQALQTNSGSPIDHDSFVVREVEDPLDEIAIFIFLRKNLSKKDWDLFVETYGVPSIFAVCTDPNYRPTDASGTIDTISKIIGNGRGVMPPGWDIKSTAQVLSSSNHPFQQHLDYQNMELVLAGTGGKLTMLSDPTGIGSGASDAHEGVFADIAQAEGEEICECFRRQVDIPELKSRGFDKIMVEFGLEMMELVDKEKNANILGAIAAAGYRTTDEQASEMLEMDVKSAIGGGMGNGDGGDIYADVDGEGEASVEGVPGGDEGTLAEDGGDEQAANKQYFDAPGSQPPAAPFYVGAVKHPDGQVKFAQQIDRMVRPYAEKGEARGEANPDGLMYITGYPTEEGRDRYMDSMRKAVAQYQQSFARGVSEDLEPVRKKVREILALDNSQEMMDRLSQLEKELPVELGRMLKNSAAAKALEIALTESIERGASPMKP